MRALHTLVVVAWVLPAPARAAGPAPDPPGLSVDASYRVLGVRLSEIALDETGTPLGLDGWFEQRVRILGRWTPRRHRSLRFELGGDLFSGLLAGDTSPVGASYLRRPRDEVDAHRGFEPRRAMLAWRSSLGQLRVGHQTSNWGYGILSNSGERTLAFGDQRLGDLVERAAFVTRPARDLYVALAFDVVYRDSNARLVDGDVGLNAVGSVFYRRPGTFLGLYSAFRNQWDHGDDDDRLQVIAVDLHGRHGGRLSRQLDWEAGFETVLLLGSTSRVRVEPDLQSAAILSGGAVLRGRVTHRPWRLSLSVEAGYASGDNDRNDDTIRHATFHPDYRVGLILFNELLGGLSARAADRLANPAHVGQTPAGTSHVPTNGGVTNALYLWPQLSIVPVRDLVFRLGVLYARAAADVVDPYSTNSHGGGSNRNYFDGDGSGRDLGLEVQLGVRYRLALGHGLGLWLGLEWARLFPGGAYDDATGQPMLSEIDRVVGRALLAWRYR